MIIDLADYKSKANEAIKAFWRKREAERRKQSENGKPDQGGTSRGDRRKKNMDGFLGLVKDIVHRNGLGHAEICLERRVLTLPTMPSVVSVLDTGIGYLRRVAFVDI